MSSTFLRASAGLAASLTFGAACSSPPPEGSKPPAPPTKLASQGTPAASKEAAPLVPVKPTDYEKYARALYTGQPDYEQKWPIEFHIRVLEGLTQDLERSAKDLGAGLGAPYFAAQVAFSLPTPGAPSPLWGRVTDEQWEKAPPVPLGPSEAGARLQSFLQEFRFLELASIKLKSGKVPTAGRFEAGAAIEFAGLGVDGSFRRDVGKAELHFAKVDGFWQCDRFVVTELRTQRVPEKLFDDVTERALQGVPAELHAMLRTRSVSDEFALAHEGPEPISHAPIGGGATAPHPGITIVDIDGDRFDDLFLWDMLGTSVLLHNEQGRGFVDRTDQYGLRFRDLSSAAFGDLNNDGQLDLVVGRWAGPSEIYVRERDTYLPAYANRYTGFPATVASVTLGDVDGDGFLDIYFGTGGDDFHFRLAQILAQQEEKGAKFDWSVVPMPRLEYGYVSAALELARKERAAGRFEANLYRFGPPNLFFHNIGGFHFVDETQARELVLFRDTLGASFTDLDGDGRPDLVVSNDFAPANIYMNRGDRFEDVSRQTGAQDAFFGMGTSVGDFDGDGDQDVYLTSMSSSAGNRIMADRQNFSESYGEADRADRLASARGNTLLRNEGNGRFTDATAEPAYAPARPAQWAYSAQFIDVDSDGWLDVFSPNGYYTAPRPLSDPYVRDL